MVIKDSFRLVSGAPNLFKVSASVVKSHQIEENNPRHVFAVLELKKNNIRHFTNSKIFNLIKDKRKRESIQVVKIESYPLPVSYNPPTKGMIINLKPFEVNEISNMNPNDLYASLVYAYAFANLVTKRFKISESYAKIIVNYLLSFYVQVFGKEYGLVAIYSAQIPKLKFLVACYVLSAFFGYKTDKKMFSKASTLAPYLYTNEYAELIKYDFSRIEEFIRAASELKVMPGLSIVIFTSKLYKYFGINILPAIEDCSRFFSVILASSVPGSRVAPRNIVKYNEKEYFKLIELMRGMF
ncbi:MAG: hypothetical protein ACFFG0_01600 [Candidatus Thorarchaeota archaeon]